MEYIYIDDVKRENFIGSGKTANCYLNGDKCIKLYKKGARRYFGIDDITLKKLAEIKSNYIITPEDFIVNQNNLIVGYTSKYIDAKSIKKAKMDLTLKELYQKYLIFKDELSKVSLKYRVHLADVHEGNILFNDLFYLIDLDLGYIAEVDHMQMNISKSISIIVDKMFNLYNRYLRFYDEYLDQYYNKIMTYYDYEAFDNFINRIYEIYDEDVTVKDIQKNKKKILRMWV